MEKVYAAALQMVPGIGPRRLAALISFFGSAEQTWLSGKRDLFLCGCLSQAVCEQLISWRQCTDAEKLATRWQRQNIKLCCLPDSEYPARLKEVYDAPYVIYYRGRLASHEMVAMVGARQATQYGLNAARQIAAALAAAGLVIVSGAARGIDTAAHQGALLTGQTVAVLGSGPDVVYPPENCRLLMQIAEQGAVITEYPPGTPARPAHFPARNRIISGMARGVIVVEAARRSGALITADCALEEGRDVFAVPGSMFSSASAGTHWLIKQGARLIDSADDVLAEYGALRAVKPSEEAQLSREEALVYAALSAESSSLPEELVNKTTLNISRVTYILLQLELRGLAVENGAKRYIRIAKEGIK